MNVLMTVVSLGLILLGAAIWRFKLVRLLSNVDVNRVDWTRKDELARYAGCFIMLIGIVFGVLAYFIDRVTTERGSIVLAGCTILVIMSFTVIYLAGLGRYMKK